MNLYTFYNRPEQLDNYEQLEKLYDVLPSMVWEKYGEAISGYDGNTLRATNRKLYDYNIKELKKRKLLFADDAGWASKYASYVAKGAFPEGEDVLMDTPFKAFSYSLNLKTRFLKGERVLMGDDYYGSEYMEHLGDIGVLTDEVFKELQDLSRSLKEEK